MFDSTGAASLMKEVSFGPLWHALVTRRFLNFFATFNDRDLATTLVLRRPWTEISTPASSCQWWQDLLLVPMVSLATISFIQKELSRFTRIINMAPFFYFEFTNTLSLFRYEQNGHQPSGKAFHYIWCCHHYSWDWCASPCCQDDCPGRKNVRERMRWWN